MRSAHNSGHSWHNATALKEMQIKRKKLQRDVHEHNLYLYQNITHLRAVGFNLSDQIDTLVEVVPADSVHKTDTIDK